MACRKWTTAITSGAFHRIERLAQEANATLVQMSAGYWPQRVARELNRALGFKHELIDMQSTHIGGYLQQKLSRVPLEDFIGLGNK